MTGFDVEISMGDPAEQGVEPARFAVAHHLTERAEIHAEVLSGGHLLHLAVAGCLFNDILREAKARGIAVSDLRVRADGDFSGEPLVSGGITYAIEIAGDAPEDDVRGLVEDCEAAAAILHTLRQGAAVNASEVRVRGDA